MKWKFWERTKLKAETVLQVEAKPGEVRSIYVKTNDAETALEIFKKLKEESMK